MTVANKHLIKLFEAYREGDDPAFHKTAESIIAEELAANHQGFAKELKKAIGNGHSGKPARAGDLMVLPKDRRDGEELVRLQKSLVDSTKIILAKETGGKVKRALDEHRHRNQLAAYGYNPKSKLLFWGPPGCGKTYTAFYLAHELGLPMGVIRLNALVSSFLGDTAFHLQKIFDFASSTPMVLLLDEVDAIGKERDDRNEVGELKRVVNSLLQALDTFNQGTSIIIAASNHQYLLDEALWRRFDDVVNFPIPAEAERVVHLSRLLSGVDFAGSPRVLARKMEAFSFADINRVVGEAVKTMILEGRRQLTNKDVVGQIDSYKKGIAHAKAGPPIRRRRAVGES
ncbi:MAG: ATP-binding protein [Chloroflexota bacterium]|nr:ATP-binding protein [Chloroflexota bacterium]